VAEKIILDCDPGVDDALAITFALGHPAIDLLGVTTVAGNVSLAKTTANALRVLDYLGATDVPVTAGSPLPLVRDAQSAEHVHGADGLGGAALPPARSRPRPGHATDFIIDTVLAAPGEITLVAVGPLTNIALAVRREPALVTSVREFVIMGGSSGRGNVTPAAEFNIIVDPEAAAIVFAAGWTVTMIGLDVTLQATADAGVIGKIAALGPVAGALLLPCVSSYADGDRVVTRPGPDPDSGDPAVHDVCAVASVARPELFGLRPARVEVETAGRWTTGMTVTDFRAAPSGCNARVATQVDVPAFWAEVLGAYATVSGPPGRR
jgi:purine nucleosidase